MLKVFLKRSGRSSGLTVLLRDDPDDRQWRQLYAFAHRWKNFIFYRKAIPTDVEVLEETWPLDEPLVLPRLESLFFAFRKYRCISKAMHIQLPWDVPNLNLVTAINCAPFLPCDSGSNVLSLNLALHCYPFLLSAQHIFRKLRQMPNLVLTLSSNWSTYNPGHARAYDGVELPHLTSLTVELRDNYRFAILIPRIVAPNVRKMNIVLHSKGRYHDFDLNDCNAALLLDSKGRHPALQEIDYVVTSEYSGRRGRPNNIFLFLADWKNLQRVSLENPYRFADRLNGQLPIVRTLSLNNCHNSINQHLEKILKRSSDAYLESNGIRGLKNLRITECPEIDMAKIREHVPAERITVHL